ncbi:MAG TPA: alpha/beta hydrolase [Chitinophagaceae bacterium]|jgi:pimeloyl-ACP methyl ester carboxylesterase|nr:alpha/beta hydrolase [Chitinophagaceae bacterium]
MKKNMIKTAMICLALASFIAGCGHSQQKSSVENKNDTASGNSRVEDNRSSDTIKAYASVNGLKIYYEINGTGEPLILLHGGFGNTEMFMPARAALAKYFKVIAVDLQGHGRTADIERPIVPDSMANDIAGLIKELNLGQTNIAGYSLGGIVALRLAIQHAELLQKVVLVSCPFKRKGWFPDLLAQQDQMGPASAEALKQSPLYQSYLKLAPRPEDWTKLVTKMAAAIKRDYDWSKEVAAIKLPVLLVSADADGVMPGHMVEFFKLLGGGLKDAGWDGSGRPASQLAIIPGHTHYDISMAPVLPEVIIPFLNKK